MGAVHKIEGQCDKQKDQAAGKPGKTNDKADCTDIYALAPQAGGGGILIDDPCIDQVDVRGDAGNTDADKRSEEHGGNEGCRKEHRNHRYPEKGQRNTPNPERTESVDQLCPQKHGRDCCDENSSRQICGGCVAQAERILDIIWDRGHQQSCRGLIEEVGEADLPEIPVVQYRFQGFLQPGRFRHDKIRVFMASQDRHDQQPHPCNGEHGGGSRVPDPGDDHRGQRNTDNHADKLQCLPQGVCKGADSGGFKQLREQRMIVGSRHRAHCFKQHQEHSKVDGQKKSVPNSVRRREKEDIEQTEKRSRNQNPRPPSADSRAGAV